MSQIVDIQRVREGDQHLKRAKRLNPKVTARPVPIEEIVAHGRQTFTVPELAAIVGHHPNTLRAAITAGQLKAANGGGRSAFRITRQAANEWWQARGGGILFADAAAITPAIPQRSRREAREKGFGFLKGKLDSDAFLAQRHEEAKAEADKLDAALNAQNAKKAGTARG